jgi:hypothetical protein
MIPFYLRSLLSGEEERTNNMLIVSKVLIWVLSLLSLLQVFQICVHSYLTEE